MAIIPINRWTEKEDNTYRVYNNMSPHYYVDATGSLNPIDITNVQTITKDTVGEIKLREKNVASIGLRTDGNKTKYLGIRPDETQESGSQQLEWTIEEAIINNTTQSITLNQTSSIDDITTNLGGQVVQSTRHFTRQMVPVTGSISNFQVKYKLHLTGLQISNSKYRITSTIVRNDISSSGTITTGVNHYKPDNGYFKITDTNNNVKFIIKLPVLLDSDLISVTNDTVHTLKDNGDGTYEYIKYPSDDLLSSGISNSVRYIDATTIYSTAALDGRVYTVDLSSNWDNSHDSDGVNAGYTATSADDDDPNYANGVSTLVSWSHIYRIFLSFDTSGIGVTPDSATLNFYVGAASDDGNPIAIESTHTDISSGTYNDFTGWEAGWDGDNAGGAGAGSGIVPYTNEIDVAGGVETNQYQVGTILAAGLSHIGSEDTTQILLMNYDYDFKDVADNANCSIYMTEWSGTSRDPYLEIVEGTAVAPAQPNFKILSGQVKILGGRVIIK